MLPRLSISWTPPWDGQSGPVPKATFLERERVYCNQKIVRCIRSPGWEFLDEGVALGNRSFSLRGRRSKGKGQAKFPSIMEVFFDKLRIG